MSPRPPSGRSAGIVTALPAYVLPLALIALFAASKIPYPLHGDQTLFMMGAETMERGGVLYRDFWDPKQPAIFVVYWLAGRLFGFNAIGLHLFELLWHLVLAAWMIRFLRPRLRFPVLASAAPVLAIGGYYLVAGNWEMTQPEMTATLPLFACFAAAGANAARPRLAWFGSGIAAGLAVFFKLLLAPIPVAIWVAFALAERRATGAAWRTLLRGRALPAVLGTLLVLVVTAAPFAASGVLGLALWTSFVYPTEALATGQPVDPVRLLNSLRWFAWAFWPLILLAFASRLGRDEGGAERVFPAAMAWWGAAFLVIAVQKLSWWRYHVLLMLAPIAILAVRGIDGIARSARERLRAAAPGAVALLLVALALAPALRQGLAAGPLFPPRLETEADLIAWQRRISPGFDRVWKDSAFLSEAGALQGTVYVFGDPRAIVLHGRRQAIPVNGWTWESYARSVWADLPAALASAAPAYVGIETRYEPLIRDNAPSVLTWLEANYRLLKSGADRAWYERTAPGGMPPGS